MENRSERPIEEQYLTLVAQVYYLGGALRRLNDNNLVSSVDLKIALMKSWNDVKEGNVALALNNQAERLSITKSLLDEAVDTGLNVAYGIVYREENK